MRIAVRRSKRYKGYTWEADILDLPGSPCCGFGKTQAEAVANVFMMNLSIHSGCYTDLLVRFSKEKAPAEIIYE